MGKLKDLTGQRFGRLVVIERAENYVQPSGQKKTQWRCKCDCGNEIITVGYNLTRGLCTSCGCVRTEENFDAVVEWFDNQDLNVEPCKNVAAVLNPKQINLMLCKAYEDNMLLWGGSDASGIPQPKFYITFETTPDKVTVFAKRTKTVKFTFGDVSILKFRAKADDVEMLQSGRCQVQAIVILETNEWNGNITPQAKVEEWEISKIEDEDINEESWEDWF